jgi:hypothetical protein
VLALSAPELRAYRALVLPHASVLTDDELAAVRAFVASGGHLVVIGRAGTFDEHYRRRARAPLADLTGVDEDVASSGPRFEIAGRSRVLYLPSDGFRPARLGEATFVPQLPLGWRDKAALIKAVIAPARVALEAPATMLSNAVVQPDRRRILIWLVRVAAEPLSGALSLTVHPDSGEVIGRAWTATPEAPARETMDVDPSDEAIRVSIPPFDVLRVVGLDY